MDAPEHDDERPDEPAPAFPEKPQTSVHAQPIAPTPPDEPEDDARGT